MIVLQIVEVVFVDYLDLVCFDLDFDVGWLIRFVYCVQYNELDFVFVLCLFEDVGIYYSVCYDVDGYSLVFSDDFILSVVLGELVLVYFCVDQGVQLQIGLYCWGVCCCVGLGVQLLSSFDFKQFSMLLWVVCGNEVLCGVLFEFIQYCYDGVVCFVDSCIGEVLVVVCNEEVVWLIKLFECVGNVVGLQVGGCFFLEQQLDFIGCGVEDCQFFVVCLQCEGCNNFVSDFGSVEVFSYVVEVEVLCCWILYCLLCQILWLCMLGLQIVIVVGLFGEELYVDVYGWVKVQFYWDCKEDCCDNGVENSFCWICSVSFWVGVDMGGVLLLCVGQEVVVDFFDGDLDWLIIIGCVYNEENMLLFGLEVSGLKFKMVKGVGWNEMIMYDMVGGELLNMCVQCDMVIIVFNDQNVSIQNNKFIVVVVNYSMSVGVNQDISVGVNCGIIVIGIDIFGVIGMCIINVIGVVIEVYQVGQIKMIVVVGYIEIIIGDFGIIFIGNYISQCIGIWKEIVIVILLCQVFGKVIQEYVVGCEIIIIGLDKCGVQGVVEDINIGVCIVGVDGIFDYEVIGIYSQLFNGDMIFGLVSKLIVVVGGVFIEVIDGEIWIFVGGLEVVINSGGVLVNGSEIKFNC